VTEIIIHIPVLAFWGLLFLLFNISGTSLFSVGLVDKLSNQGINKRKV